MASVAGTEPQEAGTTTPARPDVFVSYSRRDKDFVERVLLPALVADGKDVWIDLEDIPPAADWREQVLGGVAAANAVLFVISPDSLDSAVCAEELGRAVELNKRLIPVVRREAGGAAVPPALARPNWIWLREQDDAERAIATVLEALDSDLEWRDAHSRLAVRTNEWLAHGGDRSFLLRGSDLKAAEAWLTQQAEHEERPTAEQTRYVVASRQATTRRQRLTLAAVATALAVACALAVFALIQRGQAIDREHVARSRELAASALSVLPRDPELSVLLSAEGIKEKRTAEAEDALRRSLADSYAALTLRGHEGPATAVFGPGARSVLTAGRDGTVRTWDAASGRQTALIQAGAPLWGVATSPDGSRVVSTGEEGSATLWADGKPLAQLRGHEDTVHGPSFSRDGRLVLTASLDGTARIWDARDGRPLAVLPHRATVFSAAFDPAARRVVTAGSDGTAIVWNAASGLATDVLTGHRDWVNRATFSPDGSLIATASRDRTARIWDARTGDPRHVLRHRGGVGSVAFSPDGRRVVTASADDTAAVWDVQSGRRLAQMEGHQDDVVRAVFSPDGTLVATASGDNTARLWDAATGGPIATFRGHTDELGNPRFSPDGRRLLTSSDDGTARVWHVPQGTAAIAGGGPLAGAALSPDQSRVLTWNRGTRAQLVDERTHRVVKRFWPVGTGVFLPGGRFAIAPASAEAAAQIRDARTGELLATLPGVPAVKLAAGGDRLATASLTGFEVKVWDVRSGREVTTLDTGGESVAAVALSPDGRRAITMNLAGGVGAWDATSGAQLGTLDHHAGFQSPAAAFAADGRHAVLTSQDGPVPMWDLRAAEPQRLLRAHAQIESEAIGVAWGGDRVAVADRGASGAARIFDAATGRVVAELRGHKDEVRSVAFSPDRRWVVTASKDGTARVWEAATGRAVAEFVGHRGPLVSAAFARDGRHVLTASADGTARMHDCLGCATLDQLLGTIRDHISAGRRLTADERRVYLHAD
jgi:WD40 repeat protein